MLEKYRTISIGVFLIFFIIHPILQADEIPLISKYSYGVAEYKSAGELMERAVKISGLTKKDNGHGYAVLQSDYHFISEISFDILSGRLIDLDSASLVFDRIIYSKDLSSDKSKNYPHIQEIHSSYKFLGIGREYRYKVRVYFDKDTDNEFAMRWELYDPMDSNDLSEISGSWFLKSIEIDGKSMTYIRNYELTLLSDPPFAVLFFLKNLVSLK